MQRDSNSILIKMLAKDHEIKYGAFKFISTNGIVITLNEGIEFYDGISHIQIKSNAIDVFTFNTPESARNYLQDCIDAVEEYKYSLPPNSEGMSIILVVDFGEAKDYA